MHDGCSQLQHARCTCHRVVQATGRGLLEMHAGFDRVEGSQLRASLPSCLQEQVVTNPNNFARATQFSDWLLSQRQQPRTQGAAGPRSNEPDYSVQFRRKDRFAKLQRLTQRVPSEQHAGSTFDGSIGAACSAGGSIAR